MHTVTIGEKSLPKILFLHGFLGSGSNWLPITRQLEKEYCSILVDLPGHGGTDIPAAGDPAHFFTETVDALARELSLSLSAPCALVGYSMGGRIALSLILRHPDLFTKAVIISASPGLRSEKERYDRQVSDEGVARKIERNFDGFIEAWYNQSLFATLKGHPLFREIESERKANNPQRLALALRLLGTGWQPPLWNVLQKNRVPIRFFTGEKDERYVEIGRQMVKLTPESDLEIFPLCGHTLQIENRALFLDRLRIFFNQQEVKQ